MEYLINREGKQYGPYTGEVTVAFLRDGSLSPSDMAWHDGLDEWKALGELLEDSPSKTESASPDDSEASANAVEVHSLTYDAVAEDVDVASSPAPVSSHPPIGSAPVMSRAAKPRRGGRRHSTKSATSWVDMALNAAILLLLVGGGYYYFTAGAGRKSGEKIREKVSIALKSAIAAAPAAVTQASTPSQGVPVQVPAPAEAAPSAAPVVSTPGSDQPVAASAPSAAAMGTETTTATVASPVLAPQPPAPAQPTPIDWETFRQTPALWPRMVSLTRPVDFPAVLNGEVVGSVKVPSGTSVKFNGMHGTELKLEYQGVLQDVPMGATDLEQRVKAGVANA